MYLNGNLALNWAHMDLDERLLFWKKQDLETQDTLFKLYSGNETRLALLSRVSPARIRDLISILPFSHQLYVNLPMDIKFLVSDLINPLHSVTVFYLISDREQLDFIRSINSKEQSNFFMMLDFGTQFDLWFKMDNALQNSILKEFKARSWSLFWEKPQKADG